MTVYGTAAVPIKMQANKHTIKTPLGGYVVGVFHAVEQSIIESPNLSKPLPPKETVLLLFHIPVQSVQTGEEMVTEDVTVYSALVGHDIAPNNADYIGTIMFQGRLYNFYAEKEVIDS